MNSILKMSRGDIIATLDGDDYWPENKCEIQIKSFDDQGVVLSYGECVLVNSKGEELGHIGVPEDSSIAHNNPTGSALKRLLVDIDCFICNTAVMYRKSSLSDAGGFVEVDGLPHDFSTWVKLSLSGRFCPIPACLGYYRKHLKSATFTMDQDYYFKKQVDFLRDFCLENVQRFRDLGLPCHIDTLQDHWNRIGQKNRMIYRLTELSLFMRVDFVNPLICFVNQKSSMKKVLKRFLRI
jgi:glycosyltransferase involved in cell wall biosynthesis